jgi:hypothetical protein
MCQSYVWKERAMGDGLEFFGRVARPGDRIFEFLGGSPTAEYLAVLARTYRILGDLHDRVTDVVVSVGEAETVEEAATTLADLDADRLRDALKAQNLCDELETLGHRLRDVIRAMPAGAEAQTLEELSQELEGRERRTAEMYSERLWDLRSLPGNAAMQQIKDKADEIAEELVLQKAGFDLTAKKAEEKARRL